MSRAPARSTDLLTAPAPGTSLLNPDNCAAVGVTAVLSLLTGVALTQGLGVAAWAAGLTCGVALVGAMRLGLRHAGDEPATPADLVTLARGILTCGAAALTVDSLLGRHVTLALLALVVPALVTDAVDGWVARRTGTVTAFGGRFDGEVDAFLILVLSLYAAPSVGWWVLSAGLARYVFGVAVWARPSPRGPLEYRYWRKVVTATVSIVLAVAAADLLPRWLTVSALVVALALLAESFGRDAWWLWRPGTKAPERTERGERGERETDRQASAARSTRPARAPVSGLLALLLVWVVLLAPQEPVRLAPAAFLRLPVEGLFVAGLALVLPVAWVRTTAVLAGALLGALTVLKVLDLGAFMVLDRPFNLVTDRSQLASGVAFVRDSWGGWAAAASVIAAAGLAAAILICVPVAVGRLARRVAEDRRRAGPAVAALGALWVVCAVSGVQVAPGEPVAAAEAAQLGAEKVKATVAALGDRASFDRLVAADSLGDPAKADLSGLRGKDVLVVFVESYGRTAVEGPDAGQVQAVLDDGTGRLSAAGYTARSAYLTSPTFGGGSWLAHATLMSGVWVDNQWRHDRLLQGHRTTLTSAFARAGWRTVAVLPSNRGTWPEGESFYQFDRMYDRSSLGYAGPRFGFSAMPDQFTLAAFARLELAQPDRPPVMAEVDLASSHGPWAPLPATVDWAALGDGSIFTGVKANATTAKELWSDRSKVPDAYRTSIAYSLTCVVGFVEEYGDDDLVVVVLGDHQPSTIVSGFGGNRDVPITVIARDPAVIGKLSGWRWQDGLRPDASAPVWRMDAFRDRFLSAYSGQGPVGGPQVPP